MIKEPTQKQQRVYEFILKWKADFDNGLIEVESPSKFEIAEALEKSEGAIRAHLKGLQKKGYIKMTNKRFRNIKIIERG